MTKGLAAGATNLALALLLGAQLPAPVIMLAAAALGFASYGASLALFVVGLRHLGTARTGAYFSIAPFVGAVLAIAILKEPLSLSLGIAGGLMGLGVWLHLTEKHQHAHLHEPLDHSHEHQHDGSDPHHQHSHEKPEQPGETHNHQHQHQSLDHSHPHFPDAHHRHTH